MTTSTHLPRLPVGRVPWSLLVFGALAVGLLVLVALPLFWLGYFSLTDKKGAWTLANFATLVTDPTMLRAFMIALGGGVVVRGGDPVGVVGGPQ